MGSDGIQQTLGAQAPGFYALVTLQIGDLATVVVGTEGHEMVGPARRPVDSDDVHTPLPGFMQHRDQLGLLGRDRSHDQDLDFSVQHKTLRCTEPIRTEVRIEGGALVSQFSAMLSLRR